SLLGFDAFLVIHVFTERFGDGHGAVFVLVELQDGNENTRGSDDGVVEGVGKEGFAFSGFVAEVTAAGLKIVEAAGAVGFAVGISGGHPGFNVDHGGVFGAQVAGAALQQAIRQVEFLQHGFSILQNLF